MDYYTVRIDGALDISSEIIKAHQKYHLADVSNWLVIAHEVEQGKNPHYHSILYTGKIEAFRKYLKRKLNIGGNSDYGLSLCRDKDKYLAYIMKQGNILHIEGVSEKEKTDALNRVEKIEAEKNLSLVDKVFNHLENYKFDALDDFSFLQAVMIYFKDNKLSYPSRNWMNSLRVKFFMETKKDTLCYELKLEQISRIYGMDNYSMNQAKQEIVQLKQKIKSQQEEIYKLQPPTPYNNSKNIEKVKALFEAEDYTIDFE
jgi:hypothetical protein